MRSILPDARRPQGIQGRRFQVREELRGHRHQAGRHHPDRRFHAGLFRRLHGSNGMQERKRHRSFHRPGIPRSKNTNASHRKTVRVI